VLVPLGAAATVAATAGPAGAAQPNIRVPGAVSALPAGAVVTGPTDGTTTVTTDLALKPRDPAALDAFVAAVSTPGSAQYHQFLAPGHFASVFGPTTATIDAARSWLASTGLEVGTTSPDGLLVPVTGTVGQMERAFSVSVVDARLPSGRQSRYVAGAPAVPASFVSSVQGIVGLNTVAQPQPQLVKATQHAVVPDAAGSTEAPQDVAGTPHTGPSSTCSGANSVASQNGGYTANQLASTYGLSSLYSQGKSGAGVTVGIYELEPYTQSDITTYQSCYQVNGTVTKVPVLGGATGAQSGEAALDIEDVAGLATGSNILVYSGPQSGNGPIQTYDQMVTADQAQVLTTSWGVCEPLMATSPGQQAAESSIFAEAAAQGQTVIAASGDSGSSDCYYPFGSNPDTDTEVTVDDPADQPNVTGVGGTSLLNGAPTETTWNDLYGSGGGGVSSDFAQPTWQYGPGVDSQAALSQCAAVGRTSCREVPDVAASSDPARGYAINYQGTWQIVGGTSAASPLWAAMVAVVDQSLGSQGLITPVLYGAGTCASSPFNDVTTGTNALVASAGSRFSATANYDLATGWGSANATRLQSALSTHPACPVVSSVLPAKGGTAGGGQVTVTGANFSGATSVSFGGNPSTSFVVNSPNSITATVPAGPAGGATVDVVVQGPSGAGRTVTADRYTYARPGYWLAASDGGIFTFGATAFYGSTGAIHLNKPVVGMAATTDDRGYWLVASDGGIFSFGDAAFYGSTGAIHLNQPIVGMAPTPDGGGYWLVAADGGIFSFGDASFYGSTGAIHLNQPIVGMAPTPDGGGYWLVAADGGIFSFGDASFYGSTGALRLNRPIVGMAATSDGKGYWLVASDGGIFSFGDASFYGSTGALRLNRPIVGMAATSDGKGYWLVASDGGIFSFGDAGFYGSTGAIHLNQPIVGMSST
jgi:hypothetical protein